VQEGHRSLDEGLLIIRCRILATSLPKKENLIDPVCGAASRARADENQAARSSDASELATPRHAFLRTIPAPKLATRLDQLTRLRVPAIPFSLVHGKLPKPESVLLSRSFRATSHHGLD